MTARRVRTRGGRILACVVLATAFPAAAGAQTPYPGPDPTTANILIQAENHDNGGEGVAYHETDAVANTNYRVGDVDIAAQAIPSGYSVTMGNGEWLGWTIDVPWTGNYRVALRARSVSAATADISIGSWSLTGFALSAGSTFGWKQAGPNAGNSLTAGTQFMKVTLVSGGPVDLDCVTLVYLGPDDNRAPFPDPAHPLPIPGLVEAEYFDSGRTGTTAATSLVYFDTAAWNSGIHLRSAHADVYAGPDRVGNSADGEFQEYTLNVTQAGTYRVGARIRPNTAAATVKAYLGGSEITPAGGLVCPTTPWYRDISLGTATLAAGSTTFRFEVVSAGNGLDMEAYAFRFDPGTVARDTFPAPGTPHAVPGLIEAEHFDVGGAGITFSDSGHGNTGKDPYRADSDMDFTPTADGGHALADLTAGEWAEYAVQIAETGNYEIEARVAATVYADPASAPKTLRFLLDGSPVTGEIRVIPATQGTQAFNGDRYGSVYATTTSLPAGQHVLRLEVVQNGGFNLDWIRLTPFRIAASEPQSRLPGCERIDLGFWRFDIDGQAAGQPMGQVRDLSAHGNHGNAVGSPVYSDEIPKLRGDTSGTTTPNRTVHAGLLNFLSGQFSRAAGQYVQVPHSAALSRGDQSFMVHAWIKPASLPSGTGDPSQRQWLLQKKVASSSENGTDYAVLAGGADLAAGGTWGKKTGASGREIVLLLGTGSGCQTVVSESEIPADSDWHEIMVSYDAAKKEVLFLLDGQFRAGDVVQGVQRAGASPNSGPLFIAGGGTPGQFYDGGIDEIRISPRPLAGTPGRDGTPNASPWFWQNEGDSTPNGMVVLTNNYGSTPRTLYQPWSWRESRSYENNHCFWEVVKISDSPANYALHLYDADEIDDAYLFWDYSEAGIAREETTPYNLAPGATCQMRFRLVGFRDNGRQSPTSRVKFCRMITRLIGSDKNARFHWEIDYADVPNRSGISLYAGEPNIDSDGDGTYDTVWQSPDLADGQWHTLHAAAWVEGSNVRQHTWLDGVLVENWLRRSAETVIDPIFGFNDHLHPHQWYTEAYFDYFRLSGLGAFAPDGTLLTPFPEICDNGIDDDLNGLTDCADEANCALTAYCCRQRHNPVFDSDDDGDVDAADFGLLQQCLTIGDLAGGWAALSAECRCLDLPGGFDNRIDMAEDLDAFELCARGPGAPAPAQCDQ